MAQRRASKRSRKTAPAPDDGLPTDSFPPALSSRYGIPVRFPDLWPEPQRLPDYVRYVSGQPWPPHLWEALYATLYREVWRRFPGLVAGFDSAFWRVVRAARGRESFRLVDLVHDLAHLQLTPRPGAPRGRRGIPPKVPVAVEPPELWEALYATLYREVWRLHPRWAAWFEGAVFRVIGALLRRESFRIVDLTHELAHMQVTARRGLPRGRLGIPPDVTRLLYLCFLDLMKKNWIESTRSYRSETLGDIGNGWSDLASLGYIGREFEPQSIKVSLRNRRRPTTVARELVEEATGLQDAARSIRKSRLPASLAILERMRARRHAPPRSTEPV